ncbi:Nephrin [Frankliniella fusca]|uniref:Nephrin n=1 Tax=Frankliniella fusca TaxID=407009 RepID=A0AAE1HKE0_9NEOP|nr:Nephrin [Frankliniella fusca]
MGVRNFLQCYRPLCRAGQQHTWGVGRGETIEIPCDVDANPDDVQFTWRLNTTSDSIEIPPSRHRADRARSYLSHTPQSERDYGTLLCWGTNALGTQKQPCTFHVIPAGKPNSPINCSLANQTTESLTVTCSEGFDGGVPKQQFLLELYNEQTHLLVSNVTNHVPVFTVGGLESGLDFRADLFAYNLKGRSEPVRMHAYTLKGAERRLGTCGSARGGSHFEKPLYGPQKTATQAALQITPLVGLLVGVVASLVLAAVLIVVVLRMRGRGEGHDEKSEDRRDKAATISANAGGKGDGKGEPEQCQGQGLGLADENNPDLIPDKSVADSYSMVSESSLI